MISVERKLTQLKTNCIACTISYSIIVLHKILHYKEQTAMYISRRHGSQDQRDKFYTLNRERENFQGSRLPVKKDEYDFLGGRKKLLQCQEMRRTLTAL